jgi:outer membrane protein assembly factor BamB
MAGFAISDLVRVLTGSAFALARAIHALAGLRTPQTLGFAIVLAASLGALPNVSSAETLRWATSPTPGTAIAISGHRVVVGGATLAAYDARTGAKEWENSSNPPSDISALVADGHRVFAGGRTAGPFPQFDLFVAAFDPTTGEQLWKDTVDYSSKAEVVNAIVAARGMVFLVGTTIDFDNFDASAFIRAYDAGTGARLWDDLVGLPPHTIDYLTATEVEGQVYLVAGRTGSLLPGSPFVVRAYNARTGALVWQDSLPDSDGATVVAADHHRVFAGGTRFEQRGFLVRAYDRRDGRVIWQDSFSGGDINFMTGIALHRGRLIVSGFSTSLFPAPADEGANFGSFVKAYDPKTGTVLWEQTPFDIGRGFLNLSLAVARNSVFVAGLHSTGQSLLRLFSVRALDIETGNLQWGDVGEETAIASAVVEARKSLIIAAGELSGSDGTVVPFIRAYGRFPDQLDHVD